MRPVPRPRHALAAALLLGVAVLYGYLATLDERLSDTQVDIATAALKDHQPDLFQQDPVFSGRLWRFHTPVFLGLLKFALVPTLYGDLILPFRLLTAVVALVYLAGAYGLLYHQCHSWSVSVFVAVLSSAVTYTLGRSYWGVGSLGSITPPALCIAMVPILVLTFLHYGDPAAARSRQWRLLWVFAFVGLLGNLHLVTAMNLTIVLVIVHLGRYRFAPRAWPVALLGAACALLTASPYALYYFALRQATSPAGVGIAYDQAFEAFRVGDLGVLYPDMFKSVLNWLLIVAVLVIPAGTVLPRVQRLRVPNLAFWVWFALAGLFVAFVLQGLSQLIGFLRGQAPPVIDFVQASSLVMLPLYVLFAQTLTNLFRLIRAHRAWVRWGCAALMAAWMVPSDNLRVARHRLLDAATMYMEEGDKPRRVQRHRERAERRRELAAIAGWARRHTDPSAMFLTDRLEFRMLSHRAILAGENDARYIYYLAPWRLPDWMDRLKRQKRLLNPKAGDRAGAEALRDFAGELAARQEFRDAKHWYAVIRAGAGSEKTDILEPVSGQGWGRHYRLYRLR